MGNVDLQKLRVAQRLRLETTVNLNCIAKRLMMEGLLANLPRHKEKTRRWENAGPVLVFRHDLPLWKRTTQKHVEMRDPFSCSDKPGA
jgi:hypothetical protein